MITQLLKFTKCHWTVHLQWVNFMVCNVYTNKAVNTDMQKYSSKFSISPILTFNCKLPNERLPKF